MRDLIPFNDLPLGHEPFEDPNFKLAVMSSLMDRGTLDFGRFDTFLQAMEGSDYNYEKDGYDRSIKALDYLTRYPLTQAQLAEVDVLVFDSGNTIYEFIWPFWGGETQDFDVGGLADLKHVPNLKTLSIISMLQNTDLAALANVPDMEDLLLGFLGVWQHFESLETLPRLARLRVHRPNLPPVPAQPPGLLGRLIGKPPVAPTHPTIVALESRGAEVSVYG